MVDRSVPHPTPEAILAYLDGADLPQVAAALEGATEDAALAAEYATLQGRLVQSLYRHDCPPTQSLGDYALQLLPAAEQVAIAAHVTDCPHCTGELAQIRTFLTIEADPPPLGLADRGRRLIATLLGAPPLTAGASLRGEDSGTSRTYHAEDTTITLDEFATGRRGYRSLVGLIERSDGPAEEIRATLVAADGVQHDEVGDAGGNFVFDDLAIGAYHLEVRLGDDVIVIDDLRIGG